MHDTRGVNKIILVSTLAMIQPVFSPDGGAVNAGIVTSELEGQTDKDRMQGNVLEWHRVVFVIVLVVGPDCWRAFGASKVHKLKGLLRTCKMVMLRARTVTTEIIANEMQMLDSCILVPVMVMVVNRALMTTPRVPPRTKAAPQLLFPRPQPRPEIGNFDDDIPSRGR
jgi:hypothetical protein